MWLSPHPPPKGYEISYPLPTSGLAGSMLFFPWGVSSLWAERVPHRTSALISLNLCKILAPIFWLQSLPFSYSRYHKAQMDVLGADRETSHPKHGPIHTMDGFPLCFLALFPVFTPNSFSLVYTRSECTLIMRWLQSFSHVSVRLSSHCVWLSQSSTSWTVLQVLKFKIEVSSKTCRTTNCDLGVKKEAVSSIWLPGKYSVGRKTSSPASYIFNFFAFACF